VRGKSFTSRFRVGQLTFAQHASGLTKVEFAKIVFLPVFVCYFVVQTSAWGGKIMSTFLDSLDEEEKKKTEKKKMPDWVDPMLATLTKEYFSDRDWIFERKLDGERCLAFLDGRGEIRLMSRNKNEINNHYPELVQAFQKLPKKQMILDGEIVAFEDGISSFSKLQGRINLEDPEEARRTGIEVFYYLFDIVYMDGYDVSELTQRTRKTLLKQALAFEDPIRYVEHRNEDGEAYYREACSKEWEGIIAKEASTPYVHGRSKKWLKFKCVQQQEMVIGGYTEPQGTRVGFGALLLGYYEGSELRYAGKVGTGFDDETLRRMIKTLQKKERNTSPFVNTKEIEKQGVHWVDPDLVAEIGFEEWTNDKKLRQPRFLGLRRDKDPKDVVRESAS
jgi:bifunctional non-homologous end joining protein LigD